LQAFFVAELDLKPGEFGAFGFTLFLEAVGQDKPGIFLGRLGQERSEEFIEGRLRHRHEGTPSREQVHFILPALPRIVMKMFSAIWA
jgi:hypothetical protein